jgi:hypothetical protein
MRVAMMTLFFLSLLAAPAWAQWRRPPICLRPHLSKGAP